MTVAIAGLLGLDPAAVNVKASTGNLDGAEGAGRSISALAVATIRADR
jgi:2C-methyl-D-erythritol 2,4-cyclodiphosphate synthase